MKKLSAILFSAAVVLGATASADALARGGFHHHRHGARFGVFIGAPLVFAPWYYRHYYPPAYYPAPAVVYPSAPPVYVEQGQEAPAPRADSYWYYCPEAKAYYPYVNQCAGGWQKVSPRPPS